MVKISVVIPCYNAEDFIGEAIDSVLKQTYSPYEVIVVDDGSTDNSISVIESFGEKVKLIKQPNRGRVEARKRGFRQATGDWIALLDADDFWHPKKLEFQIQSIEDSPSDVVLIHSKDKWVGPKELIRNRIYIDDRPKYMDFKYLFRKNIIATSSVLLKRSVLNQVVNYWNLGRSLAEDYALWLLMLCHGRALFVNKVLSFYRIHTYSLDERVRFHVGNLLARKNVLSYIKQKNLYFLLKNLEWKKIMSENCFYLFWLYYSDQRYSEARKYLLKGLKYSFSAQYFLYLCFLSIFPARFVTKIKNFKKFLEDINGSIK